MVVELPSYYALQNADIFAKFSTKILDFLKVDTQVFGIEANNLDELEKILEIQDNDEYIRYIQSFQKEGSGYIKAHKLALEKYNLAELYKSNNILAISYIKSIKQENLKLKYYGIKRKNVEYNSKEFKENIASATSLREKIEKKESIDAFVPKNALEILKNKKINQKEIKEKVFMIFKYIFKNKEKKEILNIYDFTEDIYNRINKILEKTDKYEDFLKNLVVRNISKNRVKRLMFNVLLNILNEDILNNDISYVRILGINKKAAKYLKEINNDKVFVNWKDIEQNVNEKFVKLEKNSFELVRLLTGKKEKLNTIYCE